MKVVTAEQMTELDRRAIEDHGIPASQLMERAGQGVADAVMHRFPTTAGSIGIVVGKGNNGGDGLVAARILREHGYDVVVITSPTTNLEPLQPCSVLIDAILGTGLNQPVAGPFKTMIEKINALHKNVIAIDIPSGVNATTGMPMGVAIRAQTTVTMGLPKCGLFLGDGPRYAGRVEVVDIGLPREEMEKVQTSLHYNEPSLFPSLFAKRSRDAHKGQFGHLLVLAGSRATLGAGYLSSLAALRVGTGLVTYALPAAAFEKFDARYPEIMAETLPDDGSATFHPVALDRALKLAEGKNAVALGPAIGTAPSTVTFVETFLSRVKLPLVLDADALNCLVKEKKILRTRSQLTVLTPHPGEMGRLVDMSTSDVQNDRVGIATRFATEYGVWLVLKGDLTVVAAPDGNAYINPTGNPGMATAGMGDVLTGVIAGFLAQGHDPREAILGGVYLHGLAGDHAAEEAAIGVTATDVIGKLPEAIASCVP
ncbi:MAG: NAD(P)H-hydrate dehydratase [Deltaproteobacteria bacterium]|nr:NAD(P)H-hydrate dehydratase [Deltaproteobacteria bacterium]